ncbi:MAG: hypothetical protein AB7I37_12070 [Pirellulales bacterium]
MRIANEDVKWIGTPFGIEPRLAGASKSVLDSNESAKNITALVAALDDDSKYIAAHVLLTLISDPFEFADASHWYGLGVVIGGEGEVSVYVDRDKLSAAWKERVK